MYKLRVVVSKEEREPKGVKELLKDNTTIVIIDLCSLPYILTTIVVIVLLYLYTTFYY